jgi:hypothetical protein
MRQADISQLPVMQDGGSVGILDDSDIVHVLDTDEISREARFAKPVPQRHGGRARHPPGEGDSWTT